LASAATGSFSLFKLIAYVRHYGPQVSVAQFCLLLTFIVALFRTCYHAIDPIYMGWYFPAAAAHFTVTISIPVNIIVTLLVSFYWMELISSTKLQVANFLSKMKIPFAILCIIAVGFEIASSALRASNNTNIGFVTLISAGIYIVIVAGSYLGIKS
jgi:hypothetical protein